MTTYIGVYTSLASASVTSTAVTNYVDEGREFHKDRAVKVAATSIASGISSTISNASGHAKSKEYSNAKQSISFVDSLSDQQLAEMIEKLENKSFELPTEEKAKQFVKKA
ncbi:MAG: hypothetical protein IJ193_06510 [Bacilli bacterium]|nr:hypothetical protein [Bacilli bacterium]